MALKQTPIKTNQRLIEDALIAVSITAFALGILLLLIAGCGPVAPPLPTRPTQFHAVTTDQSIF